MYKITPVETSLFKLDGGAMFGIVPKVLWDKLFEPDEINRITLSTTSLLVQGNNKNIIIDTGIGDISDGKFKERYGVDNKKYDLNSSLEKIGLNTSQITDVIITHLHFDHSAGITYPENDTFKLTFPNAIYHVQKEHLNWALNPPDREKASFIKDRIMPVLNSKKFNLLDGECELFPKIEIIVSNGHTQAMQLVKIGTKEGIVVHPADLIPTSSHIHLSYGMGYDNLPIVLSQEKQKLLERTSLENWTLFFEHDPRIKFAKVRKRDKKFEIEIAS